LLSFLFFSFLGFELRVWHLLEIFFNTTVPIGTVTESVTQKILN
jgi:hypothetical protein